MPKTAVAAKVVALVTGTARESGACERMAKKVREAERLTRKGMEYCQIHRSLNQLRRDNSALWYSLALGSALDVDFTAWSHRTAPRRMIAFVAPHTKPTAIIFSTSPTISDLRLKRSATVLSQINFHRNLQQLALGLSYFLFGPQFCETVNSYVVKKGKEYQRKLAQMDEGLCPLTISPGFDTHWRMGMELAYLGGSLTLCASAVPEGLVIGLPA
ncbi:uncharacterized protein DS421_3g79410 [Arachis hypogaea]|nr:uncharacterized protein DS421_3g79410 [Arachis hypogaea]